MPKKNTIKGQHLNWIDALKKRPEPAIGCVENVEDEVWIAKMEGNKASITKRTILYNEGLHRIHMEIQSNAIDNNWRSQKGDYPMKSIKIEVNKEEGYCSIWNDGEFIAITEEDFEYTDPDTNKKVVKTMYRARLYFGEWFSGTNYNDDEERKTSGRNGMGAKATCVFAKYEEVECGDPENKKKLVLVFENGRTIVREPKITKYSGKTGYTKVTFYPDFEYFGIEGYTDEWINVLLKDAHDVSMVTGLNVTFNGVKVKSNTLLSYSKLCTVDTKLKTLALTTEDADVVIQERDEDSTSFQHISFVNGIYTRNGGLHVKRFKEAILDAVRNILNSQKTRKGETPITYTRGDIEPFFTLFVRYECDKPKFESNSKHEFTGPADQAPKLNAAVKEEIKTMATKIAKWPCIDTVKMRMRNKQITKIQKKDGARSRISDPKLDDANWAGTRRSEQCTLHITEGDSAKTMVIIGRSAVDKGHDTIGVYALRGKLINTSKTSMAKVNSNREITGIKNALGLRFGEDYSTEVSRKKLRYGKVRILCDQDEDGYHITGLVLLFFFKEYRTLLESGYVEFINTPIVRVRFTKNVLEFYSQSEFRKWKEENGREKKFTADYYKGLATHVDAEKKRIFRDPKVVSIVTDCNEEEIESMSLGFDDKNTDARKEWLGNYDSNEEQYEVKDGTLIPIDRDIIEGDVTLTYFVNNKLVQYHVDNMLRSLPSVLDGLKISQRKILFGCFDINLDSASKKLKVAQLSGVISKIGYHHGEASLQGAIIKMAQSYVGSNNINFLYPSGSFGTRIGSEKERNSGGKVVVDVTGGGDHGAPRYIYTYLETITRHIFMKEDDSLLKKCMDDDGKPIEPVNYAPIIPTLLVNGSVGIGSGWSTNIPPYNPKDLVEWIRVWLDNGEEYPHLLPWWRGFFGDVTEYDDNSIWTSGILEEDKTKPNTYHVKELPIGLWTTKFRVFLDGLQKDGLLTYDQYNTANTVHFVLYTKKGYVPSMDNDFKCLYTKVLLSNMVALDTKGRAKRYEGPEEILKEFCEYRLALYDDRKKVQLESLKRTLLIDENRYRFIVDVIEKDIVVFDRKEEDIVRELEEKKYDKIDGKYAYLLDMPFRSMTREKLHKLKSEIGELKKSIKELKGKTAKGLWLEDLNVFTVEYDKWLKDVASRDEDEFVNKTKAKAKRAPRKRKV